MPIQSEVHKNILIVRPVETLTKACAGEFEEFLQNEIDEGFRYVIFDFSQVSQVSSDGLLVVLKLINEIRKIGGEVLVTGLKSKVRVIFSVSGMFTLLEETEDLESAIEQMKEVQDAAGTREASDH